MGQKSRVRKLRKQVDRLSETVKGLKRQDAASRAAKIGALAQTVSAKTSRFRISLKVESGNKASLIDIFNALRKVEEGEKVIFTVGERIFLEKLEREALGSSPIDQEQVVGAFKILRKYDPTEAARLRPLGHREAVAN